MVSTRAIFDTNILIDFLSRVAAAKKELERYEDKAISVITWMEVMAGTTRGDEDQTRTYLATFVNLPITPTIADLAFEIRRDQRLKVPDAILRATAEVEGRLLITRNTRDFSTTDAGVRIPYKI